MNEYTINLLYFGESIQDALQARTRFTQPSVHYETESDSVDRNEWENLRDHLDMMGF